jgi:hypothetical protein
MVRGCQPRLWEGMRKGGRRGENEAMAGSNRKEGSRQCEEALQGQGLVPLWR